MAFDERAFIRRVEAAGPDEFATMLRHPAPEEERALRVHLGDERYRRMHEMALLSAPTRRGAGEPHGNVILIHGIMGGELTVRRGADGTQIWAKVLRLITGGIGDLRLAANGRDEFETGRVVDATGIMKKHYGEMILALASRWKARAFWFDWRRDLDSAAALLAARATDWFGADAPFHIVAHSMGGLVARTFIMNEPQRWAAMRDADPTLERGGRLVMLGTPNHGSFAIPQIFTGLEGMVRKLALIDLHHGLEDIVQIVSGFPGSYQMLPSPFIDAKWEPLYQAPTWDPAPVSQVHLDAALRHHDLLRDVIDPDRMVYIAGCDQPTLGDVADLKRIREKDAYVATFDGDGRVPHRLGLLEGVRTRYVVEDHGALPRNADVLATIHEVLETGDTSGLLAKPVKRRAADGAAAAADALRHAEEHDMREIEGYLHRTRRVRAPEAGEPRYLSSDERAVEDLLTRGFLSAPDREPQPEPVAPPEPQTVPSLRVRLVHGGIQDAGLGIANIDGLPVDAVAVGHYRGVKPEAAELALDRAISRVLNGSGPSKDVQERDLVLTQLTERGTIGGGLGQPFLLRDPRAPADAGHTRTLAIAGMGLPGSFGPPELTVLVRELAWALGRTGHRHLATVLIGAGNGNIPLFVAVRTWLQGLADGLVGERADSSIACVTFVEYDPARVVEIDAALRSAIEAVRARLQVDYESITAAERARLETRAQDREAEREKERLRRAREDGSTATAAELPPTRVTFTLDGRTYRMGAITSDAAIPERDVPLDPKLVREANDELAGEGHPEMQVKRGQFLQRLIVPRELRDRLMTAAPLVLILDATTARVHWEMVAQPQLPGRTQTLTPGDIEGRFLGTARGLTRQLRTGFAPPPEPPPPPRRTLRVLIVADPAADQRLPGAEEEGMAVARLFESFNRLYQSEENRVEVVRLFGPGEATRTNVLRTIMAESFDVLHYAGHAQYDEEDPASSGWIFTGGDILSAHELNRIDRIPKFVFSNACESGITPDRSSMRTAALAPGFAEAFFARGVANFVCTAWPVDDLAAQVFALRLYGHLLGIAPMVDEPGGYGATTGRDRLDPEGPQAMHVAMNRARLAIMNTPNGVRTWGAYQHYGNPYFRLFDPIAIRNANRAGQRADA